MIMRTLAKPSVQWFLIFCIALFLRLYNIQEFAEFGGDQGRDAIIISEHWEQRTLPLLGPRVSTGQFPGPFFFYLIGIPLILFDFNILSPTIFITLIEAFTVVPLFVLVEKVTSKRVALVTTLLYALSPGMISQSRMFWNPTPLPFFTAFLLLALFTYTKKHTTWLLFASGVLVGLMVQLHASSYFYLVALPAYVGLTDREGNHKKSNRYAHLFQSALAFAGGFLLPLAPYIWYESTHGFENIRGIFLSTRTGFQDTGPFRNQAVMYISRFFSILSDAMYPAIPLNKTLRLISLSIMIFTGIIQKKTLWPHYLLMSGAAFLSFLPGIIPTHYLMFMAVLPFVITGLFLNTMKNKTVQIVLSSILILITIRSIPDIMEPEHDIKRTTWAVETMKNNADNNPLAFIQTEGTSVSDLHFRFIAAQQNLPVEPYESEMFNTLFVICDSKTCRSNDDMKQARVQAMCYEKYCDREFPYVELIKWEFVNSFKGPDITVYQFSRGRTNAG